MSRTAPGIATTTWFESEIDTSSPSTPMQYTLTASYSMNPAQSPKHSIVDAVLNVSEPPDGQTTLTLYDHINPDALDDLIDASADKQSAIEIRFTIDKYLIVVRSTGTILVYGPLQV